MPDPDKEAFFEQLLVRAHDFWESHRQGRQVDLVVQGGRRQKETGALLVPVAHVHERWRLAM